MKRVIQQKRASWYSELSQLAGNKQQLRTILGFINHLLWVLADRHKCIGRLANGKVTVRRKFRSLVRQAFATLTATTGMSKYLKKYWCGSGDGFYGGKDRAWNSRPKLLQIQDLLEGWGLFKVDSPGFKGDRRPTKYFDIKVAELLIIAEVIESLLTDTAYESGTVTRKKNLTTLPGHRCFGLVAMFNSLFQGIAIWRREDQEWEATLPIWELSAEEEAAWDYRFGWELSW